MNTSNPITIGYWSTKGLGSVCRQVVIYAGQKLIAKNYKLQPIVENDNVSFDGSDWTNKDKIELKKRNSLINLPYMEIIDDEDQKHLISQSNACLLYLGRKFKMLGSNEVEQTRCEQLLLETNDLRGIITSFAYTHFKNKDLEKEAAKEVFTRAFQKNDAGKMQKFEHWLSSNDNSMFLLNNNVSIPDFNLFDILDFYIEFLKHYNLVDEKNDDKILSAAGFTKLNKFFIDFKNLPKMKKYFNSILYKLPYTNKSANFGSGSKGNSWNTNQIDETPFEVIID